MAAPVVDSITPPEVSLAPGQFVDVVVVAHDPDSASGSSTIPLTDSQGNVTNVQVSVVENDPISFGAASQPLPGVVVQRIAVTPTSATYRFTAA